MSVLTVGNFSVIEAVVSLPRFGVWHADLLLDQQTKDPISGKQLQLKWGDSNTTMVGTAVRQGVFAQYLRVRMVGGAGGLTKAGALYGPKAWRGVPVSSVVNDILQAAGETLSNTADQSVLNTTLQNWVNLQQPPLAAFRSLLQPFSATMRVLTDGNVWLGTDSFQAVDGSLSYLLEHQQFDLGRLDITEETFSLLPGQQLLGYNIGRVVRYVKQNELRTIAYAEA